MTTRCRGFRLRSGTPKVCQITNAVLPPYIARTVGHTAAAGYSLSIRGGLSAAGDSTGAAQPSPTLFGMMESPISGLAKVRYFLGLADPPADMRRPKPTERMLYLGQWTILVAGVVALFIGERWLALYLLAAALALMALAHSLDRCRRAQRRKTNDLILSGHLDEAIPMLEELTKRTGPLADTRIALASAQMQSENPFVRDAGRRSAMAMLSHPELAEIQRVAIENSLAWNTALFMYEDPDALTNAELGAQWAVHHGGGAEATDTLALVKIRMGAFDEAAVLARRAIDESQNSESPASRLGRQMTLALALAKAGSIEEATELYETANRRLIGEGLKSPAIAPAVRAELATP